MPITLPGGDPMRIARIGEDYVELLPGRGRADLASVLRAQVAAPAGARARSRMARAMAAAGT